MKIAVVSRSDSSLQNVIKHFALKYLDSEPTLISLNLTLRHKIGIALSLRRRMGWIGLFYFVAIKYFETRRIRRFMSLNRISVSSPKFIFDADSREFLEFLTFENFDLLVLGQNMILPKKVLDAGRGRFVNVHPARLPFYRGYAEPAHAILEGKLEDVGYSLHLVTPQMDEGGLIEFTKVDLQEFDSLNSSLVRVRIRGYDQLFRRVATEGVKNFLNSAIPQNQDEARIVEILSYRKRFFLDLKIFFRTIKQFRVGKSSNNFLNEK